MNKLNLKDAMQGLRVALTDDGYELRSAAGSACYDAWGVRTTVNGIPEYFPVTISVDNQRSKPEGGNGVFSIKDGEIVIKNAHLKTSMVYNMGVSVNTESKEKEAARLVEVVNSAVSERIRKELRPGGMLWGMQNGGGSLSRCKRLFADTNLPPFGSFPFPKRKLAITISGLEEWKGGIVSGATVIVNILQGDKIIHSELFSGKARSGYTRQVEVSATKGELVVAHNRPDLPQLKVTAEFIE